MDIASPTYHDLLLVDRYHTTSLLTRSQMLLTKESGGGTKCCHRDIERSFENGGISSFKQIFHYRLSLRTPGDGGICREI